MKALGVATGLVFAAFLGVFVWALTNDMPLAGEPVARLQISNKSIKTALAKARPDRTRNIIDGGYAQVMIDVAPRGQGDAPGLRGIAGGVDEVLIEQSKYGPLPKRAKDGRSPAVVYARAQGKRQGTLPRIAVLFTGLGLDQRLSEQAMSKLPPAISLAFSAYSRKLEAMGIFARRTGHEYMLQIPMEPVDYPQNDTGPKTLLASQSAAQNRPRLHWALGRLTGYFGVVNAMGGRYLASRAASSALFKELQQRGLVFFRDDMRGGTSTARLAEQLGLGYTQASVKIDKIPSAKGIRAGLRKLETLAKRSGFAIGVAGLHPVSIDMISVWAKRLKSRGLQLVPVSAAYGLSRS